MIAIDNTTLQAVARCSTEALLRYRHGWSPQEEAAPLRQGSAGHAALAAWLNGKPDHDVLAIYEEDYREWAGEHVPAGDRLDWTNTAAVVGEWLRRNPLDRMPFRPVAVEVSFRLPLAADVLYVGRMDGIVRDDAGHLHVLEHKFTGDLSGRWLRQWRMSSQLSGYVAAARAEVGDGRVVGAFVNAIETAVLPSDPARKCRTHAVPYAECGPTHLKAVLASVERTDAHLAEWRRTAMHLARRLAGLLARFPAVTDLPRVRTQGTFSAACQWCAYADWCFAGRDPAVLPMLFRHADPWEPFPGAFTPPPAGLEGSA